MSSVLLVYRQGIEQTYTDNIGVPNDSARNRHLRRKLGTNPHVTVLLQISMLQIFCILTNLSCQLKIFLYLSIATDGIVVTHAYAHEGRMICLNHPDQLVKPQTTTATTTLLTALASFYYLYSPILNPFMYLISAYNSHS